jgi:predicted HTH transcriptional regulator
MYHKDVDTYFTKLTQLIKTQPISERDKDYIARNITTVKYFEKTLIILKIESDRIPSIYDKQYFVRHGSNLAEVPPEQFSSLFSRFQN